MAGLFVEGLQFIKGIDPVADAFDSTQSTDVVDMSEFSEVAFIAHIGVGATGTSTWTVEACDDIVPTTTSAVAFHSRLISSGDTEGALTARASTGNIPTAGSSKINIAVVREDALAAIGYRYVRATFVESVNSPVLGGVLIIGKKKAKDSLAPSAID
jgi:hypothetical protein